MKIGFSLSMVEYLCNPYIQGTTVPCDTCMYIHIIHVCTYILYMYVHTYYTCMYIHIIHVCTYILYMYVHTYYVYTCMYIHIMYIHVCIYIHIMYIHVHVNIHHPLEGEYH